MQRALERAVGEGAKKLRGIGRGIKIGREFGGEKNPAAAIEAGREMVDLQEGSGEAAAIGDAPDERVEVDIERTGGTTAIVEVVGAETNDGAEGLFPGEMREIDRDIGIRGEHGASGTGRGLILIDLEGTREARAVIAEMPAGGVVIGGAGEGTAAEDEEIAAVVEEIGNCRPRGFRNDGALRKNEETSLRVGELRGELVRGSEARFGEDLCELRGRRSSAVRSRQAGLRPDYCGRKFLSEE